MNKSMHFQRSTTKKRAIVFEIFSGIFFASGFDKGEEDLDTGREKDTK